MAVKDRPTRDGQAGRERPGDLAERAAQHARLGELLARAAAGSGRVALLSGPVGAGKTALLQAAGDLAAGRGFARLGAVCARAERDLPYGVLAQLCQGAGEAALPADAARLAARLPELAAGAAPARTAAALHALTRAVLDRAARRPLLLAVDDVQHADAPSLDWLLGLLRRLDSARALLLLAEAPASPAAHSPLHDELSRRPHCHRLDLPPLTPGGVAELAAARLDPAAAGRFAAAAHPAGGGSPLLTHALLNDHLAAGQGTAPGEAGEAAGESAGAAGPGDHFRRAVLHCLHRCEPLVPAAARALAVLGHAATPALVGGLCGAAPEEASTALGTMAAAGLLDRGHFRHRAAAEAVLAELTPARRRQLHLAAARLLHEEGAPAERVAPHLVAAGSAGAAWAVPVLTAAADRALRAERIATAVDCLRLAAGACATAGQRARVTAQLARAERRLNPAAAARHLPPLAEALAAGHLAVGDGLALVGDLLWHGDAAGAARAWDLTAAMTGELAREEARTGRPHPRAAPPWQTRATELWLACTHPGIAGRGAPARREPGPAGHTAGPWPKAVGALFDVLTGGQGEPAAGAASARAEEVLEAARPSDGALWGPQAAATALLALTYADRLDAAAAWGDGLLAQDAAADTPVSGALFSAVRAEIALRAGDLPTACALAQAAFDRLPPAAWGTVAGLPLGTLVTAATRMGSHRAAAHHLEQPVPEAMFHSRYGLHYLHARGHHYLATGRHYAALADFLACGELMAGWGLDTPGLVPWRTSAAEAWLAQGGNRDEARRLINEQLARLGPHASRTRGAALRLLAATGRPPGRPALLSEATAILAEAGDRYELARALADLSAAHRALRDHRRAWSVARRAWHVAHACHATELCERLLPSRTTIEAPGRPPAGDGLASLTDAERRVAALAAAGYTNREIAGKLFITPSTIEQHLTRVYRKLNVKYRKDLPPELRADLAESA
ncbi:helix-turn-helix transcriptional regulator [Streptomyces hoynatensis]|uniref:Helix-turn-helix transcriptional regulator n=1 Tax=Streptomyces hoynatensis TaxID=1141874 RepID=A0A3A9YYL6_9ACTN|nr:LuxR family transcriptional regulator [Streptomyces hoynatensis]RKN41171.1 helix-turn-helix transcriptional regulator [Streptomyces hoynatensis]